MAPPINFSFLKDKAYFPANISCFPRRLQDVFVIRLRKTSSRRLQDVFARRLAIMSSRRFGTQKNVTLKTSSPRRMFAGLWQYFRVVLTVIFKCQLLKKLTFTIIFKK